MAVKSYNPTTASRRNMTVSDFSEITASAPLKSLTKGKHSTGGRNSYGRVTTRFRGAGNKRRYRMIDFLRAKDGVPAKVVSIEYDPNRTARIALLAYAEDVDFVKKQGAENAYFLMDYLGQEHCSGVDIQSQRENVVLYNPAKGRAFTRKIIKAAPQGLKFVALQNMSPKEVHMWSNKAKVYIDFGNHPGKDRFPREAAMAGCIIITSKRGSAAFYEDIPIKESYKFKDSRREIPRIVDLISDCMTHYDERRADFEEYRNFIKEDYTRFIEQVKAIFI